MKHCNHRCEHTTKAAAQKCIRKRYAIAERNQQILDLRRDGMTRTAVAKQFGLSPARVQGIEIRTIHCNKEIIGCIDPPPGRWLHEEASVLALRYALSIERIEKIVGFERRARRQQARMIEAPPRPSA